MSDDETSRFEFNCHGVRVEIAGERRYVEQMYQALMADIEVARQAAGQQKQAEDLGLDDQIVWVQRCTDMMRKIYMASPDDLAVTPLARALDLELLDTVYIDKPVFDQLLTRLANERTLWAELTEAGREKINGGSK